MKSQASQATVRDRALPEGRYGSRTKRSGRLTAVALAVFVAAAVAAVAFVAIDNFTGESIDTQRRAFAPVGRDAMSLTFDVTRDDPSRPAVCIVRVRVRDGSEGGRREVLVPPGEKTSSVTTVIRSVGEPVTADVFGCSYQIPKYLSIALRPTG